MRRVFGPAMIWGLVLLAVSGMMLLNRLGALPSIALLWTVAFGGAGVALGRAVVTDQRRWWAAIPAGAAFGLAAVTAWSQLPQHDDGVGGALVLAMVAAGFWVVYTRDRHRWWAVVPGGVLATLAVVVAMSSLTGGPLEGTAIAAVLFLGLAGTSALTATRPTAGPHRGTTTLTAVLAAVSLAFAGSALLSVRALDYAGPAALAVTGALLVWWSIPRHHRRT